MPYFLVDSILFHLIMKIGLFQIMALDSEQPGNLVTVNLILAKVNLKWDFHALNP